MKDHGVASAIHVWMEGGKVHELLLRRMLHLYEWVHWVDLDTLFMNMRRDPHAFLDSAYDLHVAKVRKRQSK